jgi:hypothetical protein
MTVELTSEQEAMVLRMAEVTGRTPAELLVESLALLESFGDDEERELVERRLAEADRDGAEWLSHEEVGRRMGLL